MHGSSEPRRLVNTHRTSHTLHQARGPEDSLSWQFACQPSTSPFSNRAMTSSLHRLRTAAVCKDCRSVAGAPCPRWEAASFRLRSPVDWLSGAAAFG